MKGGRGYRGWYNRVWLFGSWLMVVIEIGSMLVVVIEFGLIE